MSYTVTVPVSCPRCGGELRSVQATSPISAIERERGLVVECVSCRHVATVVVQLVDGILGRMRRAS